MVGETTLYSTGLNKQVRIASEATWGTLPAAGGTSNILRRVASDISMRKQTYRSNEIQPDRQVHDFRHGFKTAQGVLRGELSPATYSIIFNQLLAGTFTAGVAMASSTVTAVAAVLNTSPGTFMRSTGSFVTDGFKVGDVVRFAGFTAGAAPNNARNYRITGIITTTNPNDTIQVGPTPSTNFPSVGNELVTAVAGATAITASVVGKKLITPAAGSANDQSFAIEHWFSDISQSEVFNGCRATRASISLPPTGLGTCDFDILGQNVTTGTAQYFTAASGVTTSGITASVNGLLRANNTDYAIVTGLSFTINPGYTTETVVGSNLTPYIFPGIQDVTGQFTALFLDQNLQNAFLNESEIQLEVLLTLAPTGAETAINADFLNFFFPRIKLTSGNKDDKPGAIVQTFGFQALNQINGGAGTNYDATTVMIQDSLTS